MMLATRRLLDQASDVARFRHLSLRTEKAYRNWIKRYIFYQGKRHPTLVSAPSPRQADREQRAATGCIRHGQRAAVFSDHSMRQGQADAVAL